MTYEDDDFEPERTLADLAWSIAVCVVVGLVGFAMLAGVIVWL